MIDDGYVPIVKFIWSRDAEPFLYLQKAVSPRWITSANGYRFLSIGTESMSVTAFPSLSISSKEHHLPPNLLLNMRESYAYLRMLAILKQFFRRRGKATEFPTARLHSYVNREVKTARGSQANVGPWDNLSLRSIRVFTRKAREQSI